MAEENKNQDPEEQKKSSGSDDDFGLPDFEFEALDDDDDDDTSSDESPVTTPKSEPEPVVPDASDDVPSMDLDDLEGLDLDDLGDIDMSDLGDLGDLNLDDLDLEDLDMGDLDQDLEEFKESESSSTYKPEKPIAASAEKAEDIFDSPTIKNEKEQEETSDFEDDGLFFEEESFEEFDMNSTSSDDESKDMFSGESADSDSDIFGSGDSDFDIQFTDDDSTEEEAVPFAKRPHEQTYRVDDEEEEEVSKEEIEASRGKFVRIVIIGVVMFVAIGFAFLYWNGNFSEGFTGSKVVKGENKKDSKPVAAIEEPTKEESNASETSTEAKPEETKKVEEKSNTVPKEEVKKETNPGSNTKEPKTTTTQPKTTTAQPKTTTTQPKTNTTQPKTTTTKPSNPVRNAPGEVVTLTEKTGQRHLIVASFLDNQSAQDHAKKLAANGGSPVIIPPFDNAPNYRVAIVSYATLNEALQNLENYRQQYGSGVWVLRY